jgi:membrane protein
VATIIGIITLMVTASGVFLEMQTALNAIWKATPKGTTVAAVGMLPRHRAHFQARMPFGLFVPDVPSRDLPASLEPS